MYRWKEGVDCKEGVGVKKRGRNGRKGKVWKEESRREGGE